MQACKPGSVSRNWRDAYHLSGPDVAVRINRSTRPGSRFGIESGIHHQDLFDLSTHKVFRAPDGYHQGGGLLPRPFTITLRCRKGYLFSVALSVFGAFHQTPRVSRGMPPEVARTFLLALSQAVSRLATQK